MRLRGKIVQLFFLTDSSVGLEGSIEAVRVRPPIPAKKYGRDKTSPMIRVSKDECDGDTNSIEIKRQKLSLNLTGLLETDLDSISYHEERGASRSPERKISRDISAKVSIFEALANNDSKEVESKNLWFYRDGLRTPTTPVPSVGSSKVVTSEKTSPSPNTLESNNVSSSSPPAVPRKISSNKSLPNLLMNGVSKPLCLPPPLPPKQAKDQSPPPRPLSKELKLEDILSLCAEYERQIEAEQLESLSLSECEDKPRAELSFTSPAPSLPAPRIKTNGSLPREGKRLPSPCRSIPPTSPQVSSLDNEFNFEACRSPACQGSPVLSSSVSRLAGPPPAGSPRTRIRTRAGHSGPPTQLSLSDYQGGREDLADTDKTKEQLYTEAKEILALVGRSPVESPSSTGPRRPPRSKHDSQNDRKVIDDPMPSAEAPTRLLIGTVMISKGSSANLQQSNMENIKNERIKVLEEVNKNTKELSELSIAIEEAERCVDMETSLIGAEMIGKKEEMRGLMTQLETLKARESQYGQSLEKRKCANEVEINKAKQRLEDAERILDELENKQNDNMSTDEEMELLEKIKKSHEHLEAERRVFEDLEFKQMEEEASLEAGIEDICKEITEAEKSIEIAEMSMNDMEQETLEMSVNQDISILQEKRENVTRKLEEEKEKLADLELKLRQMLMFGRSESEKESGKKEARVVTVKEEEQWVENNIRPGSNESSSSEVPEVTSPVSLLRVGGTQRAGIPTPKHRADSGGSRPESADTTVWSADMTDTSSWLGVTRRERDGASSRMTGQRPLTRYLPVTSQLDFDLRAHIETAGHQVWSAHLTTSRPHDLTIK